MIKLSRLTDYGIVLMTHLAGHSDQKAHNARDLAKETGLPLPTVSKLLKVLARKGFLTSQRGVRGGYTLAQKPEDLSVAQIIEAFEGPVTLTTCSSGVGCCAHEPICPSRSHLQMINQVVRDALEKIVLSKMVRPFFPQLISLTTVSGK